MLVVHRDRPPAPLLHQREVGRLPPVLDRTRSSAGSTAAMGRMNDWTRYRLGRALRFLVMLAIVAMVLGALLGTSPIQGLVQLPNTLWDALPHDPAAGVRRRLHHHPVRGDVLVPVPGRDGGLLPGRHQDPVLRRVGPGLGAGEDQGEHRLPRGPRVHREEGRLRARRPPALGPSRHRQDADGRGRGRRDGQALRVRRPGRLHPDVHGRRHPQGQVAVPQAAPAVRALRRGHRLLRRGRLPR